MVESAAASAGAADVERNQRLAPVVDALPGEAVPYALASGEGLRHDVDGQLWTVIARGADTGGSFDAAFILGPRGAGATPHAVAGHQRSFVVFEGAAEFRLPDGARMVAAGDSVHVPAGAAVSFRFLGHMTRVLMWSSPAGLIETLLDGVDTTAAHIYADGRAGGPSGPAGGAGLWERVGRVGPEAEAALAEAVVDVAALRGPETDDALPVDTRPHVVRAHEGDRREWPDAMNAISARGATTARR